jgi:hypothetical protein
VALHHRICVDTRHSQLPLFFTEHFGGGGIVGHDEVEEDTEGDCECTFDEENLSPAFDIAEVANAEEGRGDEATD